MGIERARVVEVHADTSPTGAVGTGYVVTDRLVLTCARNVGRRGPTALRSAATGPWLPATTVWTSEVADAALLEVDEAWAPIATSGDVRWGEVTGKGPVGVTASGFPPAKLRPERFRDPEQFYGRAGPGDGAEGPSMSVTATAAGGAGEGMAGAALFAGADLVGILVVDAGGRGRTRLGAVAVRALVDDDGFVALVAPREGLRLVPVRAPSLPLPILQMP